MIQKVNQEEWIDETGKKVPVKYISIGTRMKRAQCFNAPS